VIEAIGGLPRILRMAVGTDGAKLAGVAVLMTREALAAEPEVGVVQVLRFEFLAGRGQHALRVVAVRALQLPVLALQNEAGLGGVVERRACGEADQRDAISLMFDVTARAFLLSVIVGSDDARVQSRSRIGSAFDLTVAVDAFESAGAGAELVTRCALRHALELLMRLRQGTRRDLRHCNVGSAKDPE
jgi:hypothetical protein